MSISKAGNYETEAIIKNKLEGLSEITRRSWVSPRNQIIHAGHIRTAGKNFDGSTKDTNFWTETVSNGGTVTQENGAVTLNTNTAANGSAVYRSNKRARFVAGTTQLFLARTTSSEDVTENNLRRIGAYDDDNGFFFQVTDVFSVGTRINGVDTIVDSGNFNGEFGKTFPTGVNQYFSTMIEWTPTAVYFYIEEKLLHSIEGLLLTSTNSLPITIENINSGGLAQEVTFTCVEAAIMREGDLVTDSVDYHIEGDAATHVLKYGAGKLQRITFNNTSGNSLTIYDGIDVTGRVMAVVSTGLTAVGTYEYDLNFNTGLTIVTAGNGLDATVVYE